MEGNDWRNTRRWNASTPTCYYHIYAKVSTRGSRGCCDESGCPDPSHRPLHEGTCEIELWKPRDEVAGWEWTEVPSVMMHRWRKSDKDPTTETKCSVGSWGSAWRCCRPNYCDDEHSSEHELTSWWSRRPAFWAGRHCASRPRWGSQRRFPQTGWYTARPHTWPSVSPERTGKTSVPTSFSCGGCKMSFSMYLLLKGIVVTCQ